MGTATVTLLGNGELDTLALWQRNPWSVGSDNENVALTCGEGVIDGILNVDNVETSVVAFTVSDDTNTTHVVTTGDHGNGTSVELDVVGDFASGQVNLDGVVDLDERVRVTNSPCIMRNQEWHSTATQLHTLDACQLVFSLLSCDAVDSEATLGVVDKAEVLAGLVDCNNVHESGRVCDVGSDLAVDLDKALHHDGPGLAMVESILQAVTDEDDQWQAVPSLVRAGRGLGRVGTRKLVEEPVRRRTKAVLMLLRTTTHVDDAGD